MTSLTAVKYPLFTLFTILLLHASAPAQLKASFTLDKSAGCTPLAVAFTNTTTGASASATYSWDFGNGNTSVLRNPGSIFRQEQIYTVTLKVTDGNLSSVATQTVTVYQKPVVDFSASLPKVCAPQPVTFTSSSLAGSGTLASYTWDFGDGVTQQTSLPQAVHAYTTGAKQSVSLTVGNSYGCYNTKTLRDAVELLPLVKAAFSADKTFVCTPGETVGFTNSSTGEGSLTYSWDFGDGTTSTLKDPQHPFTQKGAYPVRLVVGSSLGCSDTLVKTAYLNVANFQSGITPPAVICKGSEVQLRNTSTPRPTGITWLIDGAPPAPADTAGTVKHTFTTTGTHTLELTNHFGSCVETITKTIDVKGLPEVKGFVAEPQGVCGAPVTVAFRDTTRGAVAWGWNFERQVYPLETQATVQAPSHHFYGENNYRVTLWVTDANGCQSSVEQMVNLLKPYAWMEVLDDNGFDGCDSLVKKFRLKTDEHLASYTWHFSDSTTSTDSVVTHVFKPGNHAVWLTYTNDKGCSNTTYFGMEIQVWKHMNADFYVSSPGTTVCGNLPVIFKRVPEDFWLWDYWKIDGQYYNGDYYNRYEHRFDKEGKHTITHVMYNEGCRDTVTRVDYIDVKFPFPKIDKVEYTCEGNRDVVTFKQTSRGAESWTWDFGDSTRQTFTTDEPAITHRYSRKGEYKVVLSTTTGACTVKDSAYVYVATKQYPLITSDKTTVCMDDGFRYSLTNVEGDTYPYIWVWKYIYGYSYNDGTTTLTGGQSYDNWDYWVHWDNYPYKGFLKNVEKGKDSIRVITMSPYHRCLDTSNYVPIKVLGAAAGFRVVSDKECYPAPVLLQDTSNAYNTTIQSWQWDFGDGQVQTLTQGGAVQHRYAAPGTYAVTLKVTDAGGCSSTTSTAVGQVKVNGPKASLAASATSVALNTRVQFYNNTNTANSPTTQYEWDFGDGTTTIDYYPAHTFTTPGDYRVRLTARNLVDGCVDTASLLIRVAEFAASFTRSTSFVANAKCPPVMARFINTSKNAVQVRWDFGDGTGAENLETPSHVYTAPGVYRVTLTATNASGLSGSYTDSVVVQQPAARLAVDVLHGCTAQAVTLSADTSQGAALLWDLGDGTVKPATDTFYHYQYARAGVYRPSLLVSDARGCTALATLPQPVVIDSLYLSLTAPATICTPREVFFAPTVVSVSPNGAVVERTYHWDFGTGAAADTANSLAPSFAYGAPGTYTVRLQVQTPYGCRKEATTTIRAFQGLGAVIKGPQAICQGESVQFSGSTRLPGQPQWKWTFYDGATSAQQAPPPRTYATAGSYPVQLLVNNAGCVDTLTTTLQVHAAPALSLSAADPTICEGASTTLTAAGASTYTWSPATGLSVTTGAAVTASPLQNTTYTVSAASAFGCKATGTLAVAVVHPLKVQLAAEADVCAGSSVQLSASGAAAYQWVGNTAGLSTTASATTVATPIASTRFTVVGTDSRGCFRDTASIAVTVKPLPTVDAGESVELLAGATQTLQPSASPDVVRWVWEPATYLSCSTCAAPDATPLEPVTYKLTVSNAAGCLAADTVSIKLLCTESRVYIPNTFTPNGDGVNDVFALKGYGIRQVKSLRIYNRWGQVVFERTRFEPGDRSAAWDGKYKGLPVPVGSYVYIAEMSCQAQDFTRKGTVTVVY